MSQNYSANQFEYNYSPSRLCNWECPKDPESGVKTSAKSRWEKLKPRTSTTKFVADSSGHMLPGIPKKETAFVYDMPHQVRWPKANPNILGTAKATMGYKGITTNYLPQSTVPLKTTDIPGCREHRYL
mmetsp:Transcript_42709/g.101398  ORF Transcript_42709/g.101398 Transcript_42709/m.101398 type:complete len:128 (+) Transcript_42709:168-551(+)